MKMLGLPGRTFTIENFDRRDHARVLVYEGSESGFAVFFEGTSTDTTRRVESILADHNLVLLDPEEEPAEMSYDGGLLFWAVPKVGDCQ